MLQEVRRAFNDVVYRDQGTWYVAPRRRCHIETHLLIALLPSLVDFDNSSLHGTVCRFVSTVVHFFTKYSEYPYTVTYTVHIHHAKVLARLITLIL